MSSRMLLTALVAGLAALPAAAAQAAPGDLDTSFGGGAFTAPLTPFGNAAALDVAAAPGGAVYALTGENEIVRLRADGTYDPAFGGGDGAVGIELGPDGSAVRDIAVDPQGRLLAAGDRWHDGTWSAGVARLRADGSLDPAFDGDGVAHVKFGGPDPDTHGATVLPLADGRVVLTGRSSLPDGGYDFGAARFTAAGALDPGFAGDGTTTRDVRVFDTPESAVAAPDGTVTIVGMSNDRSDAVPTAIRFTPAGAPDASFGGDGAVDVPLPTITPDDGWLLPSAALDPQGRLVLAGAVEVGGYRPARGVVPQEDEGLVVRLRPDGQLDPAFDGDGLRRLPSSGGWANLHDVAVQPDGAIVGAGARIVEPGGEVPVAYVTRLTSAGELDRTFAGTGAREVVFGPGLLMSDLRSVDVDAEGRIVAGGFSRPYERPNNRGESPPNPRRAAFVRMEGVTASRPVTPPAPGPAPAPQPTPAPPAGAPRATTPLVRIGLGRLAARPLRFAGTSTGPVTRVEVAVVRKSGTRCTTLKSLNVTFRKVSCSRPTWFHAKGTSQWAFVLNKRLGKGRYELRVRVIGSGRQVLATTRKTFRVS